MTGTVLLAWLLSPVFAWMASEGLREGYLCGGIEPEDKTRLVYIEGHRLDQLLPRREITLHPEDHPGERISMVVSRKTAEKVQESGFVAVFRTRLESPKYVRAGAWRAAQPVLTGPGGVEFSWKTPVGMTFVVFVQIAYFAYRSYLLGDRIYEPQVSSLGNLITILLVLFALLVPSWLAWRSAVEEGRIAVLARRDDPRIFVVEKMVEGKKLVIIPDLSAHGFLEETGVKGRVELYRGQFEITAKGDRLTVVFSGVENPRFITTERLRPREEVWIVRGTPLYRGQLYILFLIWGLALGIPLLALASSRMNAS